MWSKAVYVLCFTVCFSSFFVENSGTDVKGLCLLLFITSFFYEYCTGILEKYIVAPMKKLLPVEQTKSVEEKKEESGNFDFFGRDIIRQTSKVVTKVGKNVKELVSKTTKGLDCDKELNSNGMVDTFKSKLQAIYPGTLIIYIS